MITLNGFSVVSLRVFIPAVGVWFADVDVDLLTFGVQVPPPQGPSLITIASDLPGGPPVTLIGTIDSQASGRFASTGRLRVVGGGGGWSTSVPRQQFSQPELSSTLLYNATAVTVGETVVDPLPVVFDEGYERVAGPASRVFGDRHWHVDPITGVTMVAPWLPSLPPVDLQVLGFDPNANRVEVASSSLVYPGLTLLDPQVPPRWDGVLTVADVEQTFSPTGGARASLWVKGGGTTRLMSAFRNLVREVGRRDLTRVFRYRVVAQTGNTLALQAVDATLGAPDSINVPVWTAPGVSAQFLPSSTVLVVFADGNPGLPRVVLADPSLPLQTTVDASIEVLVGPSAPFVALAGGTRPMGMGDFATGLQTALTAFATGLNPTGLAAAAAALVTALAALPPGASTKVQGV